MDLWQRYLDIYSEALKTHCESPLGFISEPVNTVSNIAFFLSAFFIYKLIYKNKVTSPDIKRLFWLVVLIGLGSAIYHSFNNPYTLILDEVSIYIFVLYSLYLITTYATKNTTISFLIPLTLVLTQLFVLRSVPAFIFDIPTVHIVILLFVTFVIVWLYKKLGKVALNTFPVILVYGLAIVVRGLDPIICPLNNFGTHFLWHFLAATATYLTVRFFIVYNAK